MLAIPGSVHLSSPSQLFLTTPNFFGDRTSPLGGLVVVLIPALVWPALSCPSSSLLCLVRALKEKLSNGQASELLFLHPPPPPHPHSYPTPPLSAGWAGYRHPRSEGRARSSPREWGTAWQRAGPPSPTWQCLSTGTEPGGAGSFRRFTPSPRELKPKVIF